jgi:hypothetical protein
MGQAVCARAFHEQPFGLDAKASTHSRRPLGLWVPGITYRVDLTPRSSGALDCACVGLWGPEVGKRGVSQQVGHTVCARPLPKRRLSAC